MFLVPDRRSLRRLGPDLRLLLTGLPLTLLAAVVLLPLAAVSAALALLWIGVLLLPGTLTLASVFARWDRARLRRWGIVVTAPPYRSTGPGARGLLRRIADARRWLDLGLEGLIALPLRVLTAALTVGWGLGAVAGLTYAAWGRLLPPQWPELPGQWALALVAGLVLAMSLPWVVHQLARFDALVTAPLLGGAETGPRPTEAAEGEPTGPVRAAGSGVGAGSGTGTGSGADAGSGAVPSEPRLRETAWSRMTIAFLAFVLAVVAWPVTAVVYELHPATAMVVTVAAGAAPPAGARWPWAGLSLTAASALAMMLVTAPVQDIAPWPWPATSLLAHCLTLAVLAIFHRWYWVLSAWSTGAVLTLAALLATDPAAMPGGTLRSVMTNGVVLVAISGGVVLLGLTARQWILARGQVERARTVSTEEMRRRRELEERGRIARELHDVVAHSMSVISVQAGTARFRLGELDEVTVREFEDIAASSRQALGEMRSLLTILRTDESLAEVPMPGLADLGELVATSRSAGAEITTEIEEVPAPPTVDLTGYRVVQEGLSNALRHARGAAIEVQVLAREGALRISVLNGPPPPSTTPHEPIPGSGLGLAGTRERVGALGGTVESAPTPTGGYALQVRIPLAGPLPR